jgi:phosphate uptake regulator
MGRKVALIGPSTLMVSLPSRWVKKQQIKKGDELEVLEKEQSLIISNKASVKVIEKTSVHLENLNTSLAWYYLTAAYRSGAEEITIHFTKDSIEDATKEKTVNMFDFLKSVVDSFIGMEIIRNTNTQYVVREISSLKQDEFNIMQRRIFFSITNMFDDILSASNKNDQKALQHIFEHSDTNINKFADYCIRIISKTTNLHQTLYTVIVQLEEMGDALKYIASNLAKQKATKEIVEVLLALKTVFALVEKFYYSPSKEVLMEFEEQRRFLRKKLFSLPKSSDQAVGMLVSKMANQSLSIVNAKLLQA